jgi:hypothetical protein
MDCLRKRLTVREDITDLLEKWPLGDNSVREIVGADGQMKIQRRVPLGILQFEANGRPDGERPFGQESLLAHFERRAEADPLFMLSHEDCQLLAAEAMLYFQRRLCFFELSAFQSAARDAIRNLRVFDFVREHADPDDAQSLDQYRAFVIYHRARAEALESLQKDDYGTALVAIEQGIDEITRFLAEYNIDKESEESEELRLLGALKAKVNEIRPRNPLEKLEEKLGDAVKREDYELAARLRDEIKNLT